MLPGKTAGFHLITGSGSDEDVTSEGLRYVTESEPSILQQRFNEIL
jgi:hypothetical protein